LVENLIKLEPEYLELDPELLIEDEELSEEQISLID
jgi:hypothetical protein